MNIERFYEKLKEKENGCIEYVGFMAGSYAWVRINGSQIGAHRLVWALHHGGLPEGMQVAHRCDNPPCCNIDHLFLASPRQNYDDMVEKDRAHWQMFKPVC